MSRRWSSDASDASHVGASPGNRGDSLPLRPSIPRPSSKGNTPDGLSLTGRTPSDIRAAAAAEINETCQRPSGVRSQRLPDLNASLKSHTTYQSRSRSSSGLPSNTAPLPTHVGVSPSPRNRTLSSTGGNGASSILQPSSARSPAEAAGLAGGVFGVVAPFSRRAVSAPDSQTAQAAATHLQQPPAEQLLASATATESAQRAGGNLTSLERSNLLVESGLPFVRGSMTEPLGSASSSIAAGRYGLSMTDRGPLNRGQGQGKGKGQEMAVEGEALSMRVVRSGHSMTERSAMHHRGLQQQQQQEHGANAAGLVERSGKSLTEPLRMDQSRRRTIMKDFAVTTLEPNRSLSPPSSGTDSLSSSPYAGPSGGQQRTPQGHHRLAAFSSPQSPCTPIGLQPGEGSHIRLFPRPPNDMPDAPMSSGGSFSSITTPRGTRPPRQVSHGGGVEGGSRYSSPRVPPMSKDLKQFELTGEGSHQLSSADSTPRTARLPNTSLSRANSSTFSDLDLTKGLSRTTTRGLSGRYSAAQALVDAVRSKDDGVLISAIESLAGGSGEFAGLNDHHPVTGRTALHEAVMLNNKAMVFSLLQAGSNPDVGHVTMGPPLLHAAAWGEADMLRLLLDANANIHASDIEGFTALHFACVGSHVEAAQVLLTRGADLKTTNNYGEAPLDLARAEVQRVLTSVGTLANSGLIGGATAPPRHHHRALSTGSASGRNSPILSPPVESRTGTPTFRSPSPPLGTAPSSASRLGPDTLSSTLPRPRPPPPRPPSQTKHHQHSPPPQSDPERQVSTMLHNTEPPPAPRGRSARSSLQEQLSNHLATSPWPSRSPEMSPMSDGERPASSDRSAITSPPQLQLPNTIRQRLSGQGTPAADGEDAQGLQLPESKFPEADIKAKEAARRESDEGDAEDAEDLERSSRTSNISLKGAIARIISINSASPLTPKIKFGVSAVDAADAAAPASSLSSENRELEHSDSSMVGKEIAAAQERAVVEVDGANPKGSQSNSMSAHLGLGVGVRAQGGGFGVLPIPRASESGLQAESKMAAPASAMHRSPRASLGDEADDASEPPPPEVSEVPAIRFGLPLPVAAPQSVRSAADDGADDGAEIMEEGGGQGKGHGEQDDGQSSSKTQRRLWMMTGKKDPVRISQVAHALAQETKVEKPDDALREAQSLFAKSVDIETGEMKWTRGQLLGEGSFGKVFLGLNQQTGGLMAVKVMELVMKNGSCTPEKFQHLKQLKQELDLYKTLNHKHIVGYYDAEFDVKTSTLFIFLEYVPGGSIQSMLQRFGKFPEELVRKYTRQLLLGLEYLHSKNTAHRDLKGGNILVTKDGEVKLADFGASKANLSDPMTITDGMKSLKGSTFWMAPEVIKGIGYGRRADVWSLGCTVVEMLTGQRPWQNLDNPWSAIWVIAKSEEGPPRPADVSDLALDFLNQCLKYDPRERPKTKALLSHPWVDVPC